LKVDHAFIAKVEGMKLGMYVPQKNGVALGKSGPTIANGLDLGQRNNLNDLKANGLSNSLANKLSPYLGKTKADAISYVKSNPLSLSKAEGAELSAAVSKTYDGRVASSFNKMGNTQFSSLPGNVQTALASVAHQYGSLQAPAVKAVAEAAQRGDYNAAAKALQGMKGYTDRRNQEAALMRA
jgi:type VI secretion system secreted protein VgrG